MIKMYQHNSATLLTNATIPVVAPDLIGGGLSGNGTFTQGVQGTIRMIVTNGGNGSAFGTFNDLFQLADTASGANARDIGTYNQPTSVGSLATDPTGFTYPSMPYTFKSVGTYYVRVCADKSSATDTGIVPEWNENNNCGPWSAVTVQSQVQSPPQQPDLTVTGQTIPSSAAVEEGSSFAGVVKNQGGAGTDASFTDLFEISNTSNPASFTQATNVAKITYASGALAAGASNTASGSYTFASAGTYYVRLCADMDSSGNGSIAESNELNNCGAWAPIQVGANTCSNGLNINTYPSCSCPTGQTQSGSSCVALTCSNGLNISQYPSCSCPTGQTQSRSSCVAPTNQPTVDTFYPQPSTIHSGQSSTLYWTSTGATSCNPTTGTSGFSTDGATSGNTSTGPLASDASYSLTCTGPGGSATANATVTVINANATISASPERVLASGTTNVAWSAQNVQSCSLTRNGQPWNPSGPSANLTPDKNGSVNGSAHDTIDTQTTYELVCNAASAGTKVSAVTVVNISGGFKIF